MNWHEILSKVKTMTSNGLVGCRSCINDPGGGCSWCGQRTFCKEVILFNESVKSDLNLYYALACYFSRMVVIFGIQAGYGVIVLLGQGELFSVKRKSRKSRKVTCKNSSLGKELGGEVLFPLVPVSIYVLAEALEVAAFFEGSAGGYCFSSALKEVVYQEGLVGR